MMIEENDALTCPVASVKTPPTGTFAPFEIQRALRHGRRADAYETRAARRVARAPPEFLRRGPPPAFVAGRPSPRELVICSVNFGGGHSDSQPRPGEGGGVTCLT